MIHKGTLTNEKKCLYCNFLADKVLANFQVYKNSLREQINRSLLFELTTKNCTINWKLVGAKGYRGLLLL